MAGGERAPDPLQATSSPACEGLALPLRELRRTSSAAFAPRGSEAAAFFCFGSVQRRRPFGLSTGSKAQAAPGGGFWRGVGKKETRRERERGWPGFFHLAWSGSRSRWGWFFDRRNSLAKTEAGICFVCRGQSESTKASLELTNFPAFSCSFLGPARAGILFFFFFLPPLCHRKLKALLGGAKGGKFA